jgi:hypothetical protein
MNNRKKDDFGWFIADFHVHSPASNDYTGGKTNHGWGQVLQYYFLAVLLRRFPARVIARLILME